MVRIKRDRSNHITILDQELVRDSQLSWKARGIFAYLWSQSENWDFNEVEVAKHSTDGRDALRSGLKELEDAGYLDRKRERDSKGRVGSSKWVLHEKPMWKNRTQDNSMQDIGTQRSHQKKITSREVIVRQGLTTTPNFAEKLLITLTRNLVLSTSLMLPRIRRSLTLA